MGATKVYDSADISIVMLGIPINKGYAEGEFVKIEPDDDAFKKVVGTDGQVTRSKTNNRCAKITISLMQSSSANDALSAAYNLDIATPGGAGIGPLLIKDRQGTSLYTAAHAWIMRRPDATFDLTATKREWVFECSDLVGLDGSN